MAHLNLDIFDKITLIFSWYVKPTITNESILVSSQFIILYFILIIITFLYSLSLSILDPLLTILYTVKFTSLLAIFMGLKFIVLIGLLIVVRGGIPRYRYDFLTKLGWIKTLSLALVIFLINLLLSYL
jgi:NADH:ubiquinone oxidoreductase subunit H